MTLDLFFFFFFDMTFSVYLSIFKIFKPCKMTSLFFTCLDQLRPKVKMVNKIFSPLISNPLCFPRVSQSLHWFKTTKGTTEQGKNFGLEP